MMFGLQTGSDSFQRLMVAIVSAVKLQYAVIYLEDIVIIAMTTEDRINHTRSVLHLPDDAGMTNKLKKCAF